MTHLTPSGPFGHRLLLLFLLSASCAPLRGELPKRPFHAPNLNSEETILLASASWSNWAHATSDGSEEASHIVKTALTFPPSPSPPQPPSPSPPQPPIQNNTLPSNMGGKGRGEIVANPTPPPAPATAPSANDTSYTRVQPTQATPPTSVAAPTPPPAPPERDPKRLLSDLPSYCNTPVHCYVPATAAEFVRENYSASGVALVGSTPEELYQACKVSGLVSFSKRGRPGDLIFFHNTQDLNQDGENNDWFSHVGVVTEVAADGSLEVVGWEYTGVWKHQVAFQKRKTRHQAEVMRKLYQKDPPSTQYYANQLFAGFCRISQEGKRFSWPSDWNTKTP